MNGVKLSRSWVLTMGPVLLVATCYAIAAPSHRSIDLANATMDSERIIVESTLAEPLDLQCDSTAKLLRSGLKSSWNVVIHEPFVLASDLTHDELEQLFQENILPTVHALAYEYFTARPNHPITILLCSSDEQFRACNLELDHQERSQYSGIYSRRHRRVVVNTASGEGTLAHELTHALAHIDFPTMPEWFDEGLASLHEECEFSQDGLRLVGNQNWRRQVALEALHRGDLRLLQDVTSKRFGSSERAHVDYAHVRSLCLYLQERGLLERFYRTCKLNSAVDPTGIRSLCLVAAAVDPQTFDDAFRAWLISHQIRGNK